MLGTYDHKFVLPNGSQVFVPSALGRQVGTAMHAAVRRRWRPATLLLPPPHRRPRRRTKRTPPQSVLRDPGHQPFLRQRHPSQDSPGVAQHRDRARQGMGDHPEEYRREDAAPARFSLPYGFIQSPVLASLALDRSALGRAMRAIARSNHTRLNCYVDDVILSGLEEEAVEDSRHALVAAAQRSG